MSDSRKQWLLKVIAGPHQGAEISLDEGKTLVGSDDACDVVLHDIMIAPQHLELEFTRSGVSASPLGGRVFLNGKRIKDARQIVPDFAFLSIGGTHLVIGPQNDKWPLLSPADIPDLEKDAPEPPPAAAEAPQAEPGTSAVGETPEIPPARRRAAWFGVVLGCLILVGWLIAWQGGLLGGLPRPDAANAELSPARKARQSLEQIGLAGRIQIEESAGRVNATGYVDTDLKQREVQALLREIVPGIRTRVWSLEKVLSSARSLLASKKVPLMISSLQEGELKISGVLPSQEEWERVRQLLLTEIPGLSGIEDHVRIAPSASSLPQSAAAKNEPPPAAPSTPPNLKLPLVELPPPPLPKEEGLDITIVTIHPGEDGLGWMKINDGSVYFQGGKLPTGGSVVAIYTDTVVILKDGNTRDLRRGDRLGKQNLQTVAAPPIVPIP